MPKMGLEATLDELEKGQTWPGTRAVKFAVPIDDLKKYGLRKPKGTPDEQQYISIWQLDICEQGGQPASFWGFRLLDAAKKAYDMKYPNQAVGNGS